MTKTKKMKNGSAYTGKLPQGCVLCEKGAKLVLLVTGRCDRRCWYCPLSGEKKGRDVFFANERKIVRISEAVQEARAIDALGTGVTGGDPMTAIDRTVNAIRALKREFGDDHHIHLYTSATDSRKIARAAKAGLDEIRFHPPAGTWKRLHRSAFVGAVDVARREGMAVGLELPAIPGKESDLAAAISFASLAELDFVNLNELEFSETNWKAMRKLAMDVKDDVSSAVAGSEELAMELLEADYAVPLHYCSSSFKDGVQLRNRIARRAKNVKKPHEIITDDSTLVKGVVETDDPVGLMRLLQDDFFVPAELVWRDIDKGRVEVAAWVLEEVASELSLESYIVEEYPTADRLEVERKPLKQR